MDGASGTRRSERLTNGVLCTILWLGSAALMSGCAIINQGEVGLKRVWGEIDPVPLTPGIWAIEVVSTDVVRVPIRTTTKTVDFVLPSKEGLNIKAKMSILYRILPEKAAAVIGEIGVDYEETIIAAVFRSQAADVSARFFAKDMYSAERRTIEEEIGAAMSKILSSRGFVVEAVLMKSIELPPGLAAAIEQKLEAEQQADQMRFMIEREKLDAERRLIEAKAERDAQLVQAEGLTESVLRLRAIEAFRELAKSPNAKVIVTNGETPLLVDPAAPGGK
jgi:regulator of protease activity HflC (stomatin/prohibitin superfamily)